MRILKNSTEIRREIGHLLSPGRGRRVAIVAFVGEGAKAFVRRPKGVEIICWPKAGGTNPLELRRLKKAGASIKFADRLHMKLYWAAQRGAIVTSANLTTNALGAGDLKEIGVLLAPDLVPINAVIKSLNARPFNGKEMERLEQAHRKLNARRRGGGGKKDYVSYLEWYGLPARASWRLGWWDTTGTPSKKAKEIARKDYTERSPHDFLSCRKTDYRASDWVLSFRISRGGVTSPAWIYVDFVVRVRRDDKKAYFADYPYQAVQVMSPRYYTPPPFAITNSFRLAFREAVKAYGFQKLKVMKSTRMPKGMLDLIYRKMK